MLRNVTLTASIFSSLALGLLLIAGCGQSKNSDSKVGEVKKEGEAKSPSAGKDMDPTKDKNKPADKKEEHGHKPGAHGGILLTIGRDSYHAEAVFEKGGVLRLYMLGSDETRVFEVESQTLTAYVKPEGETDAESFELKPSPQLGDAKDKTSLFLGRLPPSLLSKKIEVTIPSIRINNERFRIAFKNATEKHADEEMPASDLSTEQEKKLYLTTGGIYTQEDIKANGNQVASVKFRGFKPKHDLKPKVGDKICPVTLTKANPQCTWVVAGKTYEFCCPPCVEEFVITAKSKPDEIKEPSDYVKK